MLRKTILPLVAFATLSHAGSIFSVKVVDSNNADTFQQSFSSVEDAFNSLDTAALQSKINYQSNHTINANINFRGLPITLAYPGSSTKLVLNIPSLGITENFTGATRDDSVNALTDWLKNNGGSVVEEMMKKLAEVSPVDPIAGNPNSMMGTNVSNDFSSGFMNVATKQQTATVTSLNANVNKNEILVSPTYSNLNTDGINSKSYMLPLAYAFTFNSNAKKRITISLPITYTDVEGAKSASLALGLAYSQPISNNWIITPAISYGASGSVDLGALAQVASASLTSSYTWELPSDYTLSMGNMIGYYSTVKLYNGDYAYDPGIKNVVYRNALLLNIPTNNLINNTSLETFVIDTRYTGTALYMNEYQEYGVSYGYDKVNFNVFSKNKKYAIRKSLKIGVSYIDSSKANGFKVNMGFVF